jgi:hypothetical protein
MTKAAPPRPYAEGVMESQKFAHRREPYWQGIQDILGMDIPPEDLIHHSPAFAGHVNIARYLALYEAYKMALPYLGHIAEAGMWKGTCTHGFDWFQGARADGKDAEIVYPGAYQSSVDWVRKLVNVQGLDDVVRIHDMDLAKDLPAFFESYPHLQFKLVFLDCGYYDVVRECIREFWPRMTPGGVLILDNLNHETAPGETRAVREMLPDRPIRTFGFAFQPTAYIIK